MLDPTYDFTKIGFFGKNPSTGGIGNLLFDGNIDSQDGSLFFETPLSELPFSVAGGNSTTFQVAVKFPEIKSFPDDEEFKKGIYGEYILEEDAQKFQKRPFMIMYGGMGKCVCIQVGLVNYKK